MKSLFVFKCIVGMFVLALGSSVSFADSYSCAKMVVKDGWLKKYEYKGNTWGANTKKHGLVSSTAGSSTETTTGSVDPGVTTGQVMSTAQYTSSWGECSLVDTMITRRMRKDYIDQNLNDIKKHVALGVGHHVDSLALLSGCSGIEKRAWSQQLQGSMADFYDANSASEFVQELDKVIESNNVFATSCIISG